MGVYKKTWLKVNRAYQYAMDNNYYQNNRDKRIAYQKEYYKSNKEDIKRKRELKKELDPDFHKKQKEYNRDYYSKNKERIKRNRLKRAARMWAIYQQEEKNLNDETGWKVS